MATDIEKFEKQQRAERLRQARTRARIAGPKGVYDASGGSIDINTYKGHESGRNGFSVSDARRYAELFGVSLTWLYLDMGQIEDAELPGASPELARAFARLVDSPKETQDVVVSFIDFQLGQAAKSPAKPPQDQRRGQYEPASGRRV